MNYKFRLKPLGVFLISCLVIIIIIIGLYLFYYNNYSYIVTGKLDHLPRHKYNYDYLIDDNGHLIYRDLDNDIIGIKGIDVSHYQKDIDWVKVKNDGIEFAFISVGYRGYESGKLNLDPKFYDNITGALAAGLDVGVYIFSQAINTKEAIDEANFVLKHIKGFDISFPLVYDLEDIHKEKHRIMYMSKEERTNVALAFCGRILQEGYIPMVYTNLYWANDYYDLSLILNYDIWFAQYSDIPEFVYDYDIWQYSEDGRVDGISTPVDLNIYFIEKGIRYE